MIPLGICALTLAVAGCSSRTAYVIARQNAQYQLCTTNRIVLSDPAQSRTEDQTLRKALLAVLHQRGFNVVTSDESEFTLTCWVDESWDRARKVISSGEGYWADTGFGSGYNSAPLPRPGIEPAGAIYIYPERDTAIQRVVEVPYSVKGIRLRLFRHDSEHPGRPETAWEGYIEGGDRVSEEREPILLRTLLNYFGKDFIGRAKLIQ